MRAGGIGKLTGIVVATFVAFASQTRGAESRFATPYFEADIGVNWLQDIRLRSLDAVPLSGVRATVDPGIRFTFGGGLQFNEFLAVGLETGLLYNTLGRIETPGGSGALDGDLFQVPILANLVVRVPNQTRFIPFIGVGGGALYGHARLDGLVAPGLGPVAARAGANTWEGAFQAFAGLKYAYSPDLDVGLGYKFLTTTRPVWEFDGTRIRADELSNHSVSLILSIRF
jgi:OmpA-OmpF porin, OOP family